MEEMFAEVLLQRMFGIAVWERFLHSFLAAVQFPLHVYPAEHIEYSSRDYSHHSILLLLLRCIHSNSIKVNQQLELLQAEQNGKLCQGDFLFVIR